MRHMGKTGLIVTLLILIALGVGIFFLFSQEKSVSVDENQDFSGVIENTQTNTETTTPSSTSSPSSDSQITPQIKEFDITAKKWDFSPSTITVNEGDTVILNVESIDVEHGFALLDFGINEQLSPGETVRIEFVADKKGTFSFFCNVYCGSGHSGMKGILVVN